MPTQSKLLLQNYPTALDNITLTCDENILSTLDEKSVYSKLYESIQKSEVVDFTCALYAYQHLPLTSLCNFAHAIHKEFAPQEASLCSISNVKSGRCSEDCKWCAQSKLFTTNVENYPLKDAEQCLQEADYAYRKGVHLFSLVASGKNPAPTEVSKLSNILEYIKTHNPIRLCASLGLVNSQDLIKLKQAGLERYHCNLESSSRYFPNLCSRHTYQDKLKTIKEAQALGIEVCSGGIIGMGEEALDRLLLAYDLALLNIKSIPINILHPIKGTPLQDMPPLSEEEILRVMAMFRIVNPRAHLRFAGGRALLTKELVEKSTSLFMNAAIVGDLLTTIGSDISTDQALFARYYNLPVRAEDTSDYPLDRKNNLTKNDRQILIQNKIAFINNP